MHAATSRSSAEPLTLKELPSLPVRAGEVRVKVKAISVNPVDWKMREGGFLGTVQRIVGPGGPLVIGVDFAGEVVEVGPGTTGLSVGQRVVGGTDFSRKQRGSYADEVVVRPDQCAVLPDSVSYDEAACLPVAGVTAWRWVVEQGRVDQKKGARVLVLGASGGVGLCAIQIARAFGAHPVGVCSARNTALVEKLGAKAIDYTKGDPFEPARAEGPYDLIVNAVSTETYPSSRYKSLLAQGGVLGLVVTGPRDYLALSLPGPVKTLLGKPTRETLEPLVKLVSEKKLELPIEARFPLAEAETAHQKSRAGKVVGKLLLLP